MYYFLPLFFFFFIAECCIAGIIRSRATACITMRPAPLTQIAKEERTIPDGLDYELLLRQSEILPLKQISLSLQGITEQLYNLLVKDKEDITTSSMLYKSYFLINNIGTPFPELKKHIISLLKTQAYCGDMPDYFKGNKYITGDNCGALFLPIAVAEYINYTGDKGILDQSICYNAPCTKPLCTFQVATYCETVYEHVIKALDTFIENEEGCITRHNGALKHFSIEEKYYNIFTGILYCMSGEAFLPYIIDYSYKIKLIKKLQTIKNYGIKFTSNVLNQADGNITDFASCAMMYILCGGENSEEYINKLIDTESFDKISPFLQILTASKTIIKTNSKYLEKMYSSFKKQSLNAFENTALQSLIIKNICGIEFKNGHMSVNPCNDNYIIEFNYDGNLIIINNKGMYNGGKMIDGLLFNNLDYIPLKGYNKNIEILI